MDGLVSDRDEAIELAALWPTLVRLAYLLVDDTASAEDVVQTVIEGYLVKRGAKLRDGRDIAYLRTSVVNRARSVLRRRRVTRAWRPDHPEPAESAESSVLRHAQQEQVADLIARLPRRQREVIVLRYWLDLSELEIAEMLHVSPGTVKAAASRARQKIRSALEGSL